MRTKIFAASLLAAAVLVTGTAQAQQTYVTDQPASMLSFPGVLTIPMLVDTIIQITNVSDQPVALKCYYVNAVGRCSQSGDACVTSSSASAYLLGESSICPSSSDVCLPQWVETDFRVYITARQPMAWTVSQGLNRSRLPVDGVFRTGPNGESNAGTHVPPLASAEAGVGFGELKCYAVDGAGNPVERNVLKGEMTFVDLDSGDLASHNAIGFRAVAGANNGDNQLVLGGPDAEYDGCPNVIIVDHFFDQAANPVNGNPVTPFIVLAPCTENFVTQVPTRVSVQYLVFNEFEQRFSTSKPVDCFFAEQMAFIDTTNPARSIFSTNVSGTLTGQTRIRPVDGGLMGWAGEFNLVEENASTLFSTATFNAHQQGSRDVGDVFTSVH